MTDFGAGSPGTIFNNEPASPAEVEAMERLAFDLASRTPVEIVRSYEKSVPGVGSIAFESIELNEPDGLTKVAGASIIGPDTDSVQFAVVYNQDNHLIHQSPADEQVLLGAVEIAHILLATNNLTRVEAALVRHFKKMAFELVAGSEAKAAHRVRAHSTQSRPVFDVIWQLNHNPRNLVAITERREFDWDIDDGRELEIVSHVLDVAVDPLLVLEFAEQPQLQIELTGITEADNACYTKTFNGERDEELQWPRALGSNDRGGYRWPTKGGVGLLMSVMVEAEMTQLKFDKDGSLFVEDIIGYAGS